MLRFSQSFFLYSDEEKHLQHHEEEDPHQQTIMRGDEGNSSNSDVEWDRDSVTADTTYRTAIADGNI